MKINGNKIIPIEGAKLKTKYSNHEYDTLYLGSSAIYVGDTFKRVNLTLDDIIEIKHINIDNKDYIVTLSENYGELVNNLIRLKYSTSDELALLANARIGKVDGEEEFQAWRVKCKQVAKQLLK